MSHSAPVPDFVVVGNVVRDLLPGGWVPGGTAVYAAAVARGLVRRTGVVTAAPEDVVVAGLPPEVLVARAEAAQATAYENIYTPEGRIQFLRAAGSPIPPEAVPAAWKAARLVLLGPVYHEVSAALAAEFTGSIGVCAQGFLRTAGPDGRVTLLPPDEWDALPLLRRARALFLSEEDLARAPGRAVPSAWLGAVPCTVVTLGRRGARVYADSRWLAVPAIPVEEVDPTGAGDSFAAAFMVALDDGFAPEEAARFAAAAASFTVEAPGCVSPLREAVLARMRGGQALAAQPGTRRCP